MRSRISLKATTIEGFNASVSGENLRLSLHTGPRAPDLSTEFALSRYRQEEQEGGNA